MSYLFNQRLEHNFRQKKDEKHAKSNSVWANYNEIKTDAENERKTKSAKRTTTTTTKKAEEHVNS